VPHATLWFESDSAEIGIGLGPTWVAGQLVVIASQVESLNLADPSREAAIQSLAGLEAVPVEAVDSLLFPQELFSSAGAATLQTPQAIQGTPLQRDKGRNRSVSTKPTCQSLRQATIKTSVPVSQGATTRLIRELELAGLGEPISEGVRAQAVHGSVSRA
jgi:hypothetical protein